MDIPIETQIDDILVRSMRLEKKNPYIINMPMQNVLTASRLVINSKLFDKHDETRGQYILGSTKNKNLEKIQTLLAQIDPTKIESDEITSFADQNSQTYQEIMVKSITSIQENTYTKNEDFILGKLLKRRKSTTRPSATIPYYEGIKSLSENIRKYLKKADTQILSLRERDEFYAKLQKIPAFEDLEPKEREPSPRYTKRVAEAIRDSKIFKDNDKVPLSDTFLLIDSLGRCKGNYLLGSLHFLEKQMKHLIINEVNTNLKFARRGGKYGIWETLQAYTNLIPHPQSKSPWAVLFYAMRIGANHAALDYIDSTNQGQFDFNVVSALRARAQGIPLTEQVREQLQFQLANEKISKECDSFKAMCLSVLAAVSGYRDREIISTFEDWLWYGFQFKDKSRLQSRVTNTDLEDPKNVYFKGQALLLVQQFKEAAQWFLETPEVANDGLNICIAMHINGLIDSSVFIDYLIPYVIDIFRADHRAALGYIAFIKEKQARVNALATLAVRAEDGITLFLPEVVDFYAKFIEPDSEVSAIQFDGVSSINSLRQPYMENQMEVETQIADTSAATSIIAYNDLNDALRKATEILIGRNEYEKALEFGNILGDQEIIDHIQSLIQ